jgi:hypothetical protein
MIGWYQAKEMLCKKHIRNARRGVNKIRMIAIFAHETVVAVPVMSRRRPLELIYFIHCIGMPAKAVQMTKLTSKNARNGVTNIKDLPITAPDVRPW